MAYLPLIYRSLVGLSLLLATACTDQTVDADSGSGSDGPGGADLLVDTGPPPDVKPAPDTRPHTKWNVAHTAAAHLHAVACVDGHVFAVGDKGTVLHRPRGKTAFTAQVPGTTADLQTVSFAKNAKGETYGVTAGKNAAIWHTKDLGTKWSMAPQCRTYVFETLYSLHLSATDVGLGAGVAVNNQGSGSKYYLGGSWVCATPTFKGETFYDVVSFGKLAWMVGATGGKVYHDDLYGTSWKTVTTGFKHTLRGLDFVGSALGVAVGELGGILRSTDGAGKVWKAVTSPTKQHLWDVHLRSSKLGWAVGDKGVVLHTEDGGASWAEQDTDVATRLESICFTTDKEGWAVGAGGIVLRTTTAGK